MNNINKIHSVKEIKELIDKLVLSGYTYNTNFSSSEFLINFDCGLIIATRPFKHNDKMVYEFYLDTQFLSDKEVSYSEIKMIHAIIDVLEKHRYFVLSKFKKYTVEEYEREQEEKERKSEVFLKAFTSFFENQLNKRPPEDDYIEY